MTADITGAKLSLLASGAGAAGGPQAWVTSPITPLLFMGVIFWFLILRPQMRQQKEHRTKISGIKKGDQVVTGGGLVGKVIKIDENYAEIELAPNVKVKAVRSTLSDVVSTTGKAAND